MTAKEVVRRLRREGFQERQGRGSHSLFIKDERRVLVASHPGHIPTGTLRSIFKQAGWPWPPGS